MSCLVFSHIMFKLAFRAQCLVCVLLLKNALSVWSALTVWLYRITTTTTSIHFYVSHFKSHLDTSINRRVLEMRFEVEE